MKMRIRVPLRHPFYAEWVATPARLAREECAVLSGSYQELMQAAADGVRVRKVVFALCSTDHPFLGDAERDELWRAFQVPVVGLLLDREGRLAGWECEAQEGLHLGAAWTPDAIWAHRLLTSGAVLEDGTCECGRPGQRLMRAQLGIVRAKPMGRAVLPGKIARPAAVVA
jgi:hypothetical protein